MWDWYRKGVDQKQVDNSIPTLRKEAKDVRDTGKETGLTIQREEADPYKSQKSIQDHGTR